MTSFFSNIQSLFSAQYHGRYLGLILQEIGRRHTRLLGRFVLDSCGIANRSPDSIRIVAEFEFRTIRGKRRADLAVFDGDSPEPFVLIEIKYYDKPIPESGTKPAQLDDYRAWQRQEDGRVVLVLAREQIIAPTLVVKRWNDLARYLKKVRSRHGELVSLLIDYLEGEGIVMQNIDSKRVVPFMKRIVCSWAGSGRAAGNLHGPAEFSKLLSNMKLTAEIFDPHFKSGAKDVESNIKAATVDFTFYVNVKKNKREEDVLIVNDRNRLGGDLWVYAQSSLTADGDWMRFQYGFSVKIDPKNSATKADHPKAFLYAQVVGKEVESKDLRDDLFSFKDIPFDYLTENAEDKGEKVEAIFRALLVESADKLLSSRAKLPLQQKQRVRKLKRDLAKPH